MPHFVIVFVALMIFALTLVVGITAVWVRADTREKARDCELFVTGRADNRAMWLAVLDTLPLDVFHAGLADEMRHTLNTLLPPLRCDASHHPVPVGG